MMSGVPENSGQAVPNSALEQATDQAKAKDKKRTRKDSHNANRGRDDKVAPGVHSNNGHTGANGGVKRAGKIGDRKSRTIYGRGLPKKGGGGGKGTWGKLGEELLTDGTLDNRDPNYDSEEQENDITYKPVVPDWSDEEIVQTLKPMLLEYFEHGQQDEVMESLKGINMSGRQYLVVVILVTLSMEKKNEFRELASLLIKRLVKPLPPSDAGDQSEAKRSYYASTDDLKHAILDLCDNLPDLVLDTPDADKVLGKFLARAISENLLQRDLIKKIFNAAEENADQHGIHCAKEARLLLSIPHYNLGHIWGVGGGNQPMVILKKKINLLLKEYLSSGDSEEAIRCVTELDVPHFNHEVVYEAIIMVIELSCDRAANQMVHLFKRLADTAVVTADQLSHGFKRVYGEMTDISIDVPNAYFQLENFVRKCHHLKVINSKVMVAVPNKSRKRFVSEGDPGRLPGKSGDRFFDLA